MKILAISHEFPPIGGGGANACFHLTKEFVQMGHQVTLITANYMGLPERESINGVTVIRLNSKRKHRLHSSFWELLSFVLKAYPVSERVCRGKAFDICFIFFAIPSGVVGYLLKKKRRLPYIIRFGGGDMPGAQKRFALIYKAIDPAIKAIWRNADALVSNSQGQKKIAASYFGSLKYDIICNGVDSSAYRPRSRGKNERFRVLFVSRLIEGKGLQFVIPQIKKLASQISRSVELLVVGDGPYRGELEHITKECGAEEWVRFVGHKDGKELVALYQSADVFILPSASEGMPNVVLEAMACGLPVIMTPCQGSEELVDVSNGFIVEVDGFCDKLIQLALDEEKSREMGANGRKKAVEDFSWLKGAQEYIRIMKKICDSK